MMAARGGGSAARSGKKALGAALIARALLGSGGRNAASGRKKSPGLFGSVLVVVFGGVFLGVGLYLHRHADALRAQPGTKGSPQVAGWVCIAVGALIVLIGGLNLLGRVASLLIGTGLLIAGLFERPQHVPAPGVGAGSGGGVGGGESVASAPGARVPVQFAAPVTGDQSSGPLVPPPIDPHLPMPGR